MTQLSRSTKVKARTHLWLLTSKNSGRGRREGHTEPESHSSGFGGIWWWQSASQHSLPPLRSWSPPWPHSNQEQQIQAQSLTKLRSSCRPPSDPPLQPEQKPSADLSLESPVGSEPPQPNVSSIPVWPVAPDQPCKRASFLPLWMHQPQILLGPATPGFAHLE